MPRGVEAMELDLNEDLAELEPLHFEECDFSFCGDLEAGRFDLEGPPNSESAAGQVILDDDARHNGSGAQSEAGKIEEAGFDPDLGTNSASVSMNDWNLTVNHSFERYRALDPSLKLPWEMPGMQGLFTDGSNLSLPQVHGVAFEHVLQSNSREGNTVVTGEIVGCEDAAYLKAVSDLQDLDYFENKRQQTELALSRWMDILSIDWETSGVGLQLLEDWRVDPSGDGAMATLRAAFGTMNHSTLLKRAGTMKRFIKWYSDTSDDRGPFPCVFPLVEPDVWEYFKHLRKERLLGGRGFTAPSTFLETVRFAKYTIDLKGASEILESRRLLGLAALEKREKGPVRQAPPLELEHMFRLHSILMSDANRVDRIGAGCMLLCAYARARWSDVRYIHHVDIESHRNGCLVLYTTEHKMSGAALKKEVYLPLVVPWDGITNDNWLHCFMELYRDSGLDTKKVPLGPL